MSVKRGSTVQPFHRTSAKILYSSFLLYRQKGDNDEWKSLPGLASISLLGHNVDKAKQQDKKLLSQNERACLGDKCLCLDENESIWNVPKVHCTMNDAYPHSCHPTVGFLFKWALQEKIKAVSVMLNNDCKLVSQIQHNIACTFIYLNF